VTGRVAIINAMTCELPFLPHYMRLQMKFEEILPEIRKGRKARRPHWHDDIAINANLDFVSISGGSVIVQEQKFSRGELLADDWQLVPEKRKFTSWLKLYDDGSVFGFPSLEKAEESMSLAEHHGKARLVETRMIEWEATDERD